MIDLTKTQMFILLGSGLVVVAVFGLYFAFKSKNAPKTVPPKTDPPLKTDPPPKTDPLIKPDNIVIIYSNSRSPFLETEFYTEELLKNGGCWTLDSPNEKWKKLNENNSIRKIKLPAGIKATAYGYQPTATDIPPCDNKYKLTDINPGETKGFVLGSVYGFKFIKIP